MAEETGINYAELSSQLQRLVDLAYMVSRDKKTKVVLGRSWYFDAKRNLISVAPLQELKDYEMAKGVLCHEVGHKKFTNQASWERALGRGGKYHKNRLFHSCLNSIEDVFVENKMSELYGGFDDFMGAASNFIAEKYAADPDKVHPFMQRVLTVYCEARGYRQPFTVPEVYSDFAKRAAAITKSSDTTTLALAEELYETIKEEFKEEMKKAAAGKDGWMPESEVERDADHEKDEEPTGGEPTDPTEGESEEGEGGSGAEEGEGETGEGEGKEENSDETEPADDGEPTEGETDKADDGEEADGDPEADPTEEGEGDPEGEGDEKEPTDPEGDEEGEGGSSEEPTDEENEGSEGDGGSDDEPTDEEGEGEGSEEGDPEGEGSEGETDPTDEEDNVDGEGDPDPETDEAEPTGDDPEGEGDPEADPEEEEGDEGGAGGDDPEGSEADAEKAEADAEADAEAEDAFAEQNDSFEQLDPVADAASELESRLDTVQLGNLEIVRPPVWVDHEDLENSWDTLGGEFAQRRARAIKYGGKLGAGLNENTTKMYIKLQNILLEASQTEKLKGQPQGKIHGGSLHKVRHGDFKVFAKKNRGMDATQIAVALVVDCSGSMGGGGKADAAREAAFVMGETLSRCGVSFGVYGFTSYENCGKGSDYPVVMELKGFREIWQGVKERLENLGAYRNNYDASCILDIYKRLVAVNAKRRILIVISDGQPAPEEPTYLKNLIPVLSQGVDVIGVGLAHTAIDKFYPKNIKCEVNDLAEQLAPVLQNIMLDKRAKRGGRDIALMSGEA